MKAMAYPISPCTWSRAVHGSHFQSGPDSGLTERAKDAIWAPGNHQLRTQRAPVLPPPSVRQLSCSRSRVQVQQLFGDRPPTPHGTCTWDMHSLRTLAPGSGCPVCTGASFRCMNTLAQWMTTCPFQGHLQRWRDMPSLVAVGTEHLGGHCAAQCCGGMLESGQHRTSTTRYCGREQ